MSVRIIQHPVGQGGFLSGRIKLSNAQFGWAYDCGSNQPDPLLREIDRASNDGPLDLLFISHLHSDHVNGIDKLLAKVQVKEVVLPHLNQRELVLLFAADMARGSPSATFSNFLSDIGAWFANRGVSVVTFVRGQGDDDGPDGPPDILGPSPDGVEQLSFKWSRPPIPFRSIGRTTLTRVSHQANISVRGNGSPINWLFLPHVHPAPTSRLNAFYKQVKARLGATNSISEIADQCRTPTGRETLIDCYNELWVDHNLVSLSLFAGPASLNGPHISSSGTPFGWISTGDSNLLTQSRRHAWLDHYSSVVDRANVLVVPHHGARSNFHGELLSRLPNLRVAAVPYGRNTYGHPHPNVINQIGLHRLYCAHVREAVATEFLHWD